jgi:AcrR family transcriptional regulator
VARSQRERLFAATVACVAEKGCEATTVADLLELSGVSRSAFYEHFSDKEDCFVAAYEAVAIKSMELLGGDLAKNGSLSLEERGYEAIHSLFEMIASQPAAAKLCFADVYAAGERGRRAVQKSTAGFAVILRGALDKIHGGGGLPEDMVYGVLGGALSVIQTRLRRGEGELLPDQAADLWEWALSYERPSMPLRVAGRRPRPVDHHPPPFVAYSQAERIIRALAASAGERGYPTVTIAEIAARASVSQATFYSHFQDKEAALFAALDSIGSQMLAAVMPAARRAPDWPNGVRAAVGALCAFCAAEPDLARLVTVEIYAAGPAALEQRERSVARMRSLLEPRLDGVPKMKPIFIDAVIGAVWALLYAQIVNAGPKSLPQIAPLASYMVMAPFLGPEEAAKFANGDGRRNND